MSGAAVEEGHLLAHQFNGDGGDFSGGPGAHAARTQVGHLFRIGKDGEIEFRSVFGVVVEPQERCDLVHELVSTSIVASELRSRVVGVGLSHGDGGAGEFLLTDRELLDAAGADLVAEAGRLRNVDDAVGRYPDFGIDDVLIPIALAGADVARPDESSLSRHGDVMGASDSGFDHAAAPNGSAAGSAVRLNKAGFAVTADAAEFDVDDAAGAEVERGLRAAQAAE